mmetsp:Transcript_3788/g.4346  ORF Transcript_3788/g.4346 Transcript_3788/m.4346 type:complete len:104 (+) Transcript_3788:77-388(+)
MVEDKDDSKSNRKQAENFQKMMKPENIGATMRHFIPMGVNSMVENFIEHVNIATDGPHLLQAAIFCGQPETVQTFIARGVNLTTPPIKVPSLQGYPESHDNYR